MVPPPPPRPWERLRRLAAKPRRSAARAAAREAAAPTSGLGVSAPMVGPLGATSRWATSAACSHRRRRRRPPGKAEQERSCRGLRRPAPPAACRSPRAPWASCAHAWPSSDWSAATRATSRSRAAASARGGGANDARRRRRCGAADEAAKHAGGLGKASGVSGARRAGSGAGVGRDGQQTVVSGPSGLEARSQCRVCRRALAAAKRAARFVDVPAAAACVARASSHSTTPKAQASACWSGFAALSPMTYGEGAASNRALCACYSRHPIACMDPPR